MANARLQEMFNAAEKKLSMVEAALGNLLDALQKTTVYNGVRYGKTMLAKTINDAYDALDKVRS